MKKLHLLFLAAAAEGRGYRADRCGFANEKSLSKRNQWMQALAKVGAAPDRRTSPRDASRAIDPEDDALPPRNRA